MLTLNWCKLVKGLMHVEIMIVIYPRLLFPLIFVDFLTLTHQWKTTKINVWKKDFFYLMFPFYTSKNTLPIGIYKGKIWHPLYIWKFSELLAKFFTTNICVLFISFVIPVDFFFFGCELKPRAIKQWGGYFKTEKLDFFNSSEWM